MNSLKIEKATGNPNYQNTFCWKYKSSFDCFEDWALVEQGERNEWIIYLHGHGSDGTQLFTRQDVVDLRLKAIREQKFGILAPNLRGNAWMCPAAARDLHELIVALKKQYKVEKTALFSASMGGTGSLIYAALHPEDIDAVIAGCPATDLERYCNWCKEQNNPPVLKEIIGAIEKHYDKSPEIYAKHSACKNVEKLNMPLHLSHGGNDAIIPVSESRILAKILSQTNPDFVYEEIKGGNHDAPLKNDNKIMEWLTNIWRP